MLSSKVKILKENANSVPLPKNTGAGAFDTRYLFNAHTKN